MKDNGNSISIYLQENKEDMSVKNAEVDEKLQK